MIIPLAIATLAAGHGISAGYLLRQLRSKPLPNQRRWQVASLLFPAGALAYLLWLGRQELKK